MSRGRTIGTRLGQTEAVIFDARLLLIAPRSVLGREGTGGGERVRIKEWYGMRMRMVEGGRVRR